MINLCVFGAGRIGSIHTDNVALNPDVSIRYVVDAFPETAKKLADKYGAKVVSTEEALADPELHGVIIASSTNTHADLIEASARAGKAIFCEKPIDLDIKRVRECLETVEQAGVICCIGFNRRSDPQFAAIKEAIKNGSIGELEMLSLTSRDPSPPPVEYIKVSGGLFRDMMIHDLDVARWLLDEEPVEVFATASCLVDPEIGKAGDVDSALVTLKTASGKLCQISCSRRAAYGYDQRVEAHGSKGMAQITNQLESNLVLSGDNGVVAQKPQHFFLERYEAAYRIELNNFVDCINGKAQPVANTHDGVQSIVLADAALASLETGKAVIL
ncbi:inositol 2-dehydrogenase [Neptunomonas phycophila]|jgi:myo-inositol 2-dehydrogenase/D-chiro-inositol 1-dehydrogenase|uniref:inositol 2-dehydrogenase n=1 Tax=Neptunomonas phycophila TaxID=1572645 RepID=UPI0030B9025F